MKYKKILFLTILIIFLHIFKLIIIKDTNYALNQKGYKTIRIYDVDFISLFKEGYISVYFRSSKIDNKFVYIDENKIKNGRVLYRTRPVKIIYF